jgi:hypothetical protein
MRLMRAGKASYEKPTLVCDDAELRDVSILLSEVDDALLSGAWRKAIGTIDHRSLPLVAPMVRRAACLERPGRIFATDTVARLARGAAPRPRLGVKSGRPIGANDDIRLPATTSALYVNAGVAVVIGARSGNAASAAGFCLFVNVFVGATADLDASTAAAISSAPTLLALGPYLVSPDDPELTFPLDLQVAVDGQPPYGGAGDFDVAQGAEIVSSVDRFVRLSVGDVVLIGGLAGCFADDPPVPGVRSGDRIVVDAGRLGCQTHVCVPV